MIGPTINDGPMPTSQMPGCSRFTWPGNQRDSHDEETTDWRAVCEKTARTVRRAGSVQADPDPYHTPWPYVYSDELRHKDGTRMIIVKVFADRPKTVGPTAPAQQTNIVGVPASA